MDNTWDRLLARIETKVNRHSLNTWFLPAVFVEDDGQTITVRVPDSLVQKWLVKHYAGVLAEALEEVGRKGSVVVFVSGSGDVEPLAPEEDPVAEPTPIPTGEELAATSGVRTPSPVLPAPSPAGASVVAGTAAVAARDSVPVTSLAGLNPRYSFDTFVVGPSNQFAEAACRAVAETPSRSYNPLFIYGGVGLGKTHLMHAIGHYVLIHHRNAHLTYISSERFMNEMINAVKNDRIFEFRERYRSVDVLLVDDIQFLAGKEGTQTEFFHTFNSLFDAQKQLVISSDCPPREIPSLEERLRSRFEWGLIADIQPPDLETKVAILKKKAEAESIPLPDNVALYIAGKIKSNIRELEGSLIRLIAYASLKGQEISLALAQEVLKHVLDHDEKAVTIEVIQKYVADYYHLRVADLKSRNNAKSVARPRQIAMHLCKRLTNASLPEIGRSFGGKHHSTVIHSIKTIERLMAKDRDFHNLINSFAESLR